MLKYLSNVVTLRLDEQKCSGCGVCTLVCPHGVLQLSGRKAEIVDRDACIECGACAGNCPTGAIHVTTGTGCAAGLLMGALGKSNECCGPSGVSPEKGQSCCSGPSGVSPEVDETAKGSCCGGPEPFQMLDRQAEGGCCGAKAPEESSKGKRSCC